MHLLLVAMPFAPSSVLSPPGLGKDTSLQHQCTGMCLYVDPLGPQKARKELVELKPVASNLTNQIE